MIRLASTLLLLALAQSPPPPPGQPSSDPVKVEAILGVDRVRPGDDFQIAVVFTIAEHYHIYAPDEPAENYTKTALKQPAIQGIAWESPRFPTSTEMKSGVETLRVYEKRAVVTFRGHADDRLPLGEISVPLEVDFQFCNEEVCFPPQRGVPLALKILVVAKGEAVVPARADLFADAGGDQESGFGDLLKRSLWVALAGLLIGGIGTAFTPCVLPMIPFTVAFFTNQVDRSKGKTLLLALTYTAGIVTTFSLLGWLFGRAGSSAGSILGNPWVVGVFIAIFVALGLSCFGLFELTIPAPIMAKLGGGGSREGRLGAYVMGLLLGVVAAPCVGPVLASLLLWIAKHGSGVVGLLLMAVYGLGLGLPFIALAFASGSIPRAGAWMVWVKEVFGVLIFGTALYYLYTIPPNKPLIVGLFGVGCIALAIRYLWPAIRHAESEHESVVLGIVAALLATYSFLPKALTHPIGLPNIAQILFHESWLPWRTDHDQALADAKRDGRPAFVDFTAAWCPSCHEMERMMEEPDVWAVLQRFVLIQLDCTNADSAGTILRNERYGKHGLGGVPSSAYYNAKGELVEAHYGALEKEAFVKILRSVDTRPPLGD
ncbi:MAG: thioredoxin family protein [Planctomycetes bacterium]|nr:thioredoxin family protein [Planctomycetota bacterium]